MRVRSSSILSVLIVVLAAVLAVLVCMAATLEQRDSTDPSDQTNVPATQPAAVSTESFSEPLPSETKTTAPTETIPEPADDAFVRISDYIPDIVVDLKYATKDNFTGVVIYEFSEAWLRYGTVKKLMAVQSELKLQGLMLKIWDAYRPTSAQEKLWQICPDPTYVSKPGTGSQSHCRGIAVDITLVDAAGRELVMPTQFDDFSKQADRDYSDCPEEAAENARLLETVMVASGFKPYFGEWWHYADTESCDISDFEP